MAGSFSSLLKRIYLSLYNWIVFVGWFQVLYIALKTLNESGHEQVYDAVEKPLLLAQSAAFLEVVSSSSYCIKENKACVYWADKYFKDCLCNTRDKLSFASGLISLVSWGVAEIPQIITNFQTKSSHGVSILFLLTWIIGDIFNLVGCLLEPATLPTQYYTAVLYTTSTVILVLQSLYYDHLYTWCKTGKTDANQPIEEAKKPLKPPKAGNKDDDDSAIPIPGDKCRASVRRDFYFTSARSLAGSATPPSRSYLWTARSGPSAMGLDNDSSSDDDATHHSATSIKKSITQPKPIPRSAGYAAFLATSINMPLSTYALVQEYVAFTGRKLLQEHGDSESYVIGQWLGWMMAAIYMGGRIPQIYLNIKRGSVEGLNPLMFVFALIANVTYVGSILIRSTQWEKIKANLPWLLDAIVCVGLDLFIILQYIYYKYLGRRASSGRRAVADDDEEEDHHGSK